MSKSGNQKSPIGERLREARTRKGLSQKKLGILAGIDQFSASARINQYERDKHVPDFSTARRLADKLEIPVTYLYAENDDLAELIRVYGELGSRKRQQLLRLFVES